jgi:hypothetical protein
VIRSAYGLFYAAPEIQSLASSNDFAPNTLRPTWTASPTTPNLGYNPEGNVSAQQALSNAPLTIFPFLSRHFPYGQVHQWNFSLQHQLTKTLIVEAFHQGTASEHLILFDNIDARAAGSGNVQQLLPYPGFANSELRYVWPLVLSGSRSEDRAAIIARSFVPRFVHALEIARQWLGICFEPRLGRSIQ